MKWPWVSRLAFELVADERDRLRLQNDQLIDATQRLSRRQLGMPETPKPGTPMPPKEPPTIPAEIEEIISMFESEGVRVTLRQQCQARVIRGSTWEQLRTELLRQVGPIDEPEGYEEEASWTEPGTEPTDEYATEPASS